MFAKRRERADRLGSGMSVEQQPATGVFELLKLVGQGALVRSERLSGLGQAGMLGDDDEAGEALTSVSTDEHRSQRFGDLRGVNAWKVEVSEAVRSRARPQWDVVLVGEGPEGGDTAAELGSDIG